MYTIIASIVMALALCPAAIEAQNCPIPKLNRKNQVARLGRLQDSDVVVQAKFIGLYKGKYRFLVDHIWEQHNGGLKALDELGVVAGDSKPTAACLDALRMDDNFILMLKPLASDEERSFTAMEAPVSSKRRNHRQLIWERLCASSGGDRTSCAMKVTMPRKTIFYRGSIKLLQCRVESSSPVTQVTWTKDGSNIDTTEYRMMTGLHVNTKDMENSFVMIMEASHFHNGAYSCQVRNADGATARGTTQVTVLGPRLESHYVSCNIQNFCFNGGTCRHFVDDEENPFCECRPGFRGRRCEELDPDITMGGVGGSELANAEKEIGNLTIVVGVLSCLMLCLVVVGLLYVRYLKGGSKTGGGNLDDLECEYRPYENSQVATNGGLKSPRRENNNSAAVSPKVALAMESEATSLTVDSAYRATQASAPSTPRSRLSANSS